MTLAVDCGSTRLKAALFNEEMTRVREASVAMAYTTRDRDRAELDPEDVWSRFVDLLAEFPSSMHWIALTSQAQTFTVLNEEGRPVLPFMSWMDRRAAAEAEEIQTRLGAGFHRHCSFPRASTGLQISKVLWATRRTGALEGGRVFSLPEFLAERMTGFRGVDRNLAAMGGLYDLESGGWWEEALELCGVGPPQLGCLLDVGARVPARSIGSSVHAPAVSGVVYAGNDQTAGAYAALGRGEGILVTLGTALVAYRFAGGSPGPFPAGGCWGPYPGGGYYELATFDEGCAALDWARTLLMPGASHSTFDREAARALPGAALFFPSQMRTGSAWLGDDGPAAKARAVLEGIAFSVRRLMVEGLGTAPEAAPRIVVGGGGSASDAWLGILADILDRPCEQARGDSLLGAAAMAVQGAVVGSADGARVFAPHAEGAARYRDLYPRWLAEARTRERRDQ